MSLSSFRVVILLVLVACTEEEEVRGGNPVAENCGVLGSPGNEVGVGKYCTKSSSCPVAQQGTALQCSNVLVSDSLPLLCSRLCDLAAADSGCGADAVCKNIIELGFDLTVCIPRTCQPLFTQPL